MMIDRLYEAVEKKGHVCVGLDTCADYVPKPERDKALNDAEAVLNFNKALIDSTFKAAACFKVQIAYYEEMGIEGLKAYSATLNYIKEKGGISIADIKRGDIADTALRYAKAHYSGDFEADFVTLSPYMGMDAIEPWFTLAKNNNKGAFILMRTSNPGMKDFQKLEMRNEDLGINNEQCKYKKLYQAVGDKLAVLAAENTGNSGYGMFGAVVGCTERDEAAKIRADYPNLFFLIPGYGAQGGAAEDAALLLREGNGGIVNASRSIITAWKKEQNNEKATLSFAAEYALKAAVKMRDELRKAV